MADNDIIDGRAIVPQSGGAGAVAAQGSGMIGGGALSDPAQLWRNLTGSAAFKRWLPIGLAIVGAAAVLALALSFVEPSRAPLFPGVPEAETARMLETLQKQGFDARIEPDSGLLTVPAADKNRARIALASEGLPETGLSGYDVLNDMPFGTSRAVERARLQQTQETGLAASIEEVSGVESARVHIAAPEPSAFVRSRSTPTASVFVKLKGGRVLGDEQVTAIVHLVSSSVPGLAAEDVSVVDQRGNLLSKRLTGDLAASAEQLAYTTRLEDAWRERIAKILIPIVGADNFSAEVALDLDFNRSESTSETYDKDAVLRSEQRTVTQSGGGEQARGIPGTVSNTPPAAAQLTPADGEIPPEGEGPAEMAAQAPAPADESTVRNYEVGKQVSVTRDSVGEIRRASVAVALRENGQKLSDTQLKEIETLLNGALGIDKDRGDVLVVRGQSFAALDAMEEPPLWEQQWVQSWGTKGVVLLLGLAALFMVGRPLKKALAAGKSKDDEASTDAAQAAADSAAAESSADAQTSLAAPTQDQFNERLTLLRELIAADTGRASQAFGRMMTDEKRSAQNG